jgi:transglutaminase-like putative cysteine protease
LVAGQAQASDKPEYAPAGSWVIPVPIPAPPASADDTQPVRRLLLVAQEYFGPNGDEHYTESANRIQSAQGLSLLGNITVNWRPDTDTLIFNKIRIIRGDRVIDLLKQGQTFTVLRRETNLEMAMLDGKLTATMQPEGLQVGDILNVALTIRHSDPTMHGHSEQFLAEPAGPSVDHLMLREVWPDSKPMRYRVTEGLSQPKITKATQATDMTIDMLNATRPAPPSGAPKRFSSIAEIETSQFADWAEVSALMSPLYQKAATLDRASPIRAEAAAIASASSDPKVRAAMALHLVQDKVRYLFLGMDQGGYVPADADVTWQRKFGDCKGKTVVLLALLQQLGIDAEPALVSTTGGDGLDEWLPAVGLFDHVIIRARIGGKTYWLDGTRLGDRGLDDIAVPPFHWALPVQAAGSQLEALVQAPLDVADTLTMKLDATAGLDAPAPAHLEMVLHGDQAIGMKLALANLSADDRAKVWPAFWQKQFAWIEVRDATASFDEATGAEVLLMDGAAAMSWPLDSEAGARAYEADGARLGFKPNFKREPGPYQAAPYAVDYPAFVKFKEVITLPQGGAGFSMAGETIDTTIAAVNYRRASHLEGNLFTLESSTRSLAAEFPYAEAVSARNALAELTDSLVQVRAPKGYRESPAELRIRLTRVPTTIIEYLDRGEARLATKDPKAIEDFDEAVKRKPGDAVMLDRRCYARGRTGQQLDLALADCNDSLDIEPHSASALDSRALIYFRLGQNDKALKDLNAALKIEPKQVESLYVRSLVKRQKGDLAGAYVDLSAAKALDPHIDETYARFGVE